MLDLLRRDISLEGFAALFFNHCAMERTDSIYARIFMLKFTAQINITILNIRTITINNEIFLFSPFVREIKKLLKFPIFLK